MKDEGSRMREQKRWGLPLCIVFAFFLPSAFILLPCFSGTVRTLDGKTYDGEVKLEQAGQLTVTGSKAGKPLKFELSEVLQATFGADTPKIAVAQPGNGSLLAPWQALDVGKLKEKSAVRYTDEDLSIKSAGGNVGGTEDAFCFIAQPIAGDVDVVAKFTTASNNDVAEGVMIRTGAEPDAAYAGLFYQAGGLRFMKRSHGGEATDSTTVGGKTALPIWLRLSRRSNAVTAFYSRDGNNWEHVTGEAAVSGSGTLAGLAVCGRGNALQGGHATNVKLTSLVPGAIVVAPTSLKEGLMLRSGTLLAGAQIENAGDGKVTFNKGGRRETVLLINVARIVFREIGPDLIAKIPEKRTGVLLREGDFVEGEFRGLARGRVQLSSVLFGLAYFETRDKAAALVLGDIDPSRPEMVIRTRDGSSYVAKSVTPDKDLLVIEDPLGGRFSMNRWDVVELSAGGGRMESLTQIKPAKVEPSGKEAPGGFWVNSTGVGLPMTLAGAVCEKGVTLSAGTSATWDLAGNYRALTFKCGVPQGVLATAPVRFIVLADGKELYKSRPRTSLDEALVASVSVKDAKTLTLKVESTGGEAVTTPGLWGDIGLVK